MLFQKYGRIMKKYWEKIYITLSLSLVVLLFWSCSELTKESEYRPLKEVSLRVLDTYATALQLEWPQYRVDGFYQYRLYADTIESSLDTLSPIIVKNLVTDTTYLLKGLNPKKEYYISLEVVSIAGTTVSRVEGVTTTPVESYPFVGKKEGSMVLLPSGSFWSLRRNIYLDTIFDTLINSIDTTLIDITIDTVISVVENDSSVAALSHNFYIDTTEVTEEMWSEAWGDKTTLSQKPKNNVNWYEMILFCNARSKRAGFDTAYTYDSIIYSPWEPTITNMEGLECSFYNGGYRLPTEDEWVYAYRAGAKSGYFWGKEYLPTDTATYPKTAQDTTDFNTHLWWDYNNDGAKEPFDVAQKKPNNWGLYDMAGNVQELLWNSYNPSEVYSNRIDYHGLTSNLLGQQKYRGGEFSTYVPQYLTDWWRAGGLYRPFKGKETGFRTVRVPQQ